MKKTALLIDGGWFSKGLGKILRLPNGWPSAAQVIKNAKAVLEKDEELFRIFYYDCEPFDREVTNPVNGSKISEYSNAIPQQWRNGTDATERIVAYIAKLKEHLAEAIAEVARLLV
jgi:uncharacterized LabA/DUF88 family protein